MNGNWKGIAHVHSDISYDGKLSYAELRQYFLGKGLNFALITEHIEHLKQTDIDRVISECATHSDDSFLFIPGIEMDCFVIYFLGIRPIAIDFSSNKTIFESLKKTARLCILSHPIKAKYCYPDWVISSSSGVEVLNTKHDGQHYFRPQSEKLFQKLKKKHQNYIALAGMDFHNKNNFTPIHLKLSIKGPLTEKHVLSAIKANSFEILKGNIRLSSYTAPRRFFERTRIHLMDLSHKVHLLLSKRGIKPPIWLKNIIRKVMEGH